MPHIFYDTFNSERLVEDIFEPFFEELTEDKTSHPYFIREMHQHTPHKIQWWLYKLCSKNELSIDHHGRHDI
jgi:truncated hemoglobin YjbI